MRLLLVDDDAGFRALLRATFESVDIDVAEAADAAAAADSVLVRRPDVVVLDVHMPGQSGIEFCRHLKNDPATREIGVVLLTGSGAETSTDAIGVGADAFLLKPFSPLELLAVVERLAGGLHARPFRAAKAKEPEEQLVLYARDLRHLLEIERGQRAPSRAPTARPLRRWRARSSRRTSAPARTRSGCRATRSSSRA